MIGSINLWDPGHVTFTADLVTAFLLGLVHGVTPDEHTWPITFSYAVGSHSTRRGLLGGLVCSLAFTAQPAMARELAHSGLAHWSTFGGLDEALYVIVGIVIAAAGLFVMGRGVLPHLPLPGSAPGEATGAQPRELKSWMPAVH